MCLRTPQGTKIRPTPLFRYKMEGWGGVKINNVTLNVHGITPTNYFLSSNKNMDYLID